jgi:serine/threonine protein kinase
VSELFQCPQGHRWELPLSGDAGTTSLEVKCPVCGQVGQTRRTDDAPAAALSESETIPPHPAAVAEAITDTHLPGNKPGVANQSPEANSNKLKNPPNIPGYEILEPLGEGGMGQVYKARQIRLDRIVALKVIHPDYLSNPDAIRRFHREAKVAARLAHPHLVTVFDVDEIACTHFLVMEYVEGTDLGRLVKTRGVLQVTQACDYVRQAALGLEHIHERGLVHRDIKPTNLFLTGNGSHIKVLDMGLARLNQPGPSDRLSDELTQPGAVMGTPAFLAPEQARDSRRVDIRSDIYSLGCTFYYLLTGRVPFPGIGLAEIVVQHQLDEPEPIEKLRPDVPAGVIAIIRKMMAKKPEERFQTPADVAAVLVPFCNTLAIAPPGTALEADRRAGRVNAPVSANLLTGVMTDPARPVNMNTDPSGATEMLEHGALQALATKPKRRRRAILLGCGVWILCLFCAGGLVLFSINSGTPGTVAKKTVKMPSSQDYQQADEHNKRALARNPREYDGAINDLSEAIQLAPDKPEYFANRGRRYILRGQQNNTPEDYDKAVADFTEAIRITPKMADYWNQRGWAYLNKEDWQKALADIDMAVSMMPTWASCYSNRGWAYKIKGDYAAALLDFNKAIELDQRHAPAFQLRADLLLQRKDYQQAIKDFDQAIQIDPTYAAAYFGRGQAKSELVGPRNVAAPANPPKILEEALDDLNQAINLRPSFARAYLVRSEIFAQFGDEASSKTDYLEAIRRDPRLTKEKK